LAVENLNHWLAKADDVRLLRLLNPITAADRERLGRAGAAMTLRAVLGPTYMPVDNAGLLNFVLPVAAERGMTVAEYHLDEKKFMVRWLAAGSVNVNEVIQRVLARNPQQGAHACNLNEFISFGASLYNSETGHGSYGVDSLVRFLICINTAERTERRGRHVGGRQEGEEDYLQDDTRRLDNAAIYMKVRDALLAATSDARQEDLALKMAEANNTPIALPPQVPVFDFIENVGQRFELTGAEVEVLKEETVKEQARQGGRLTTWAVSQGITALARRGGETGEMAFDRKLDLEKLGWDLLEDGAAKLANLAGVAVKQKTGRK
jgi:hypothetical protein